MPESEIVQSLKNIGCNDMFLPHLLDGLNPLFADGVPDADGPVRAVPGDGLAVDHDAVVAAVLPSSHPRLNSDAENW